MTIRFDVASAETTRMASGPLNNGLDFLQLQGRYTVSGRAGGRVLNFTARGRRGDLPRGGPPKYSCLGLPTAFLGPVVERVTRRNLRAAAALVQRPQRFLQRQPHLLGVPAPRHALAHELPAGHLHAEALEAQRARPVERGVVVISGRNP